MRYGWAGAVAIAAAESGGGGGCNSGALGAGDDLATPAAPGDLSLPTAPDLGAPAPPDLAIPTTPTFADAKSYAASGDPYFVGVADINKDGALDVVVGNLVTTPGISVLLGDGTGLLGPPKDTSTIAPYSLVMLDANGDGKADVLVAGSSGSQSEVDYLVGKGDGSFEAPMPYFVCDSVCADGTPRTLALGDVDGDGRLDVLVHLQSSTAGTSIAALLTAASGEFQVVAPSPSSTAATDEPGHVASGDFDHDGHLDVVTTSRFNAQVQLGDGTGAFVVKSVHGVD